MTTNPLLIEMLAHHVQVDRIEAAETDRRIRQAERAQVRRQGRLFAALARFLAVTERRRAVSHPAR